MEATTEPKLVFPDVREHPVAWKDTDYRPAKDFKAIIDARSGKVFSIVSNDYQLIRHEDAISEVEKILRTTKDLNTWEVQTDFYNDGGRMRRKFYFRHCSVEIRNGDSVSPELQLFNSYDTTWPFIVLLGAFRFVCTNGLVVGKKFLCLRKRHVYKMDRIGLREELSTALARFSKQTDEWKKWADQILSETAYQTVMKQMQLGAKATKEIKEKIREEAGAETESGLPLISIWLFYNMLTWYITHKAASLNHQVEMERRLRKAMQHFKGR